jgi:hypothetical protein
MRTVSMGDDPLPGRPRDTSPKNEKEVASGKMAPVPARPSTARRIARHTITREECESFIRTLAGGRKVTITPTMITNARRALKAKYQQMAETVAKGERSR